MKVKVVNQSSFELPAYATSGAAGMDVKADLKRYWAEQSIITNIDAPTLEMKPRQQYVIPTGLFFALPEGGYDPMVKDIMSETTELNRCGWEIDIRPRSGLAAKHGVTVLNSPGTLDEDYRGELKIILICHNDKGYTVTHGDRIAQILFKKIIKAGWELVETLDETKRGTGGFGHTGNK